MTRRSPLVDLGPMALPVADWGGSGSDIAGSAATELTKDALKLQGLLAVASAAAPEHEACAGCSLEVNDTLRRTTSTGLLARSAGIVHAAASAVAAALAHGAAGSGGIRLELHSDLLPEASVTVEVFEGRWVFSLHVGDIACRERLANELDLLVAEVGPRVGRPLEIRLFAAYPASHMIRSASWQSGGKG